MEWRIWNKEESIMGMEKEDIIDFHPNYIDDEIVIISDENQNDVYFNSINGLKKLFNLDTDDVEDIVDYAIVEFERGYKSIGDLLNPIPTTMWQTKEQNTTSPIHAMQCRRTKVENNGMDDERINLILDGVNVRGGINLKILSEYKKQVDDLMEENRKALEEKDYNLSGKLTKSIKELICGVTGDDSTITLNAIEVCEYQNILIALCANSQVIFIDKDLTENINYSEIKYERKINDGKDIQKVHYVNIHVKLEYGMTRLTEKNNSVFVNIF